MKSPLANSLHTEMVKSQPTRDGRRRSFEQVSGPFAPSTPSPCCPSIDPDLDCLSTSSISPTPIGLSSFSSTSSHASLPTFPKTLQTQPYRQHTGYEGLQTHDVVGGGVSQCEVVRDKMTSSDASMVPTVTLQQHLQHSGAGQEAAMQSFILERFLPAAQAVAADHDHGNHTASKSHRMIPPLSLKPKIIHNAPFPSQRSSCKPDVSKSVSWSRAAYVKEMEKESLDNEPSSKACGFLRVGVKSVLSRINKTAHSSVDSVSRRVAFSCVQRTSSSNEFDVGTQRKCSPDRPAFTSSFPTIAAGGSWRFVKSPKSSFPRNGNSNEDGSPLQYRCTSYCSGWEHEQDSSSLEAISSMDVHHTCSVGKNTSVIEEDAASGSLDMEGNSLHHKDSETQWIAEAVTEDDEPEFYDASSRLDSISCTGSMTPCSAHLSPKCLRASAYAADASGRGFETSYKPDSVHFCCNVEEPVVFHANHSSYSSTVPSSVILSCLSHELAKVSVMETGGRGQEGKDCLESSSEPLVFSDKAHDGHDCLYSIKRTLEASPVLPEKAKSRCVVPAYTGFESPHRLGWPLGISGLQSSAKKPLLNKSDKTQEDLNVAAPPVPPAPSSSWLGKAMALNASKPSMLVSLQQKEKGKSVSNELKFTPSDPAKEVSWEDVVKESQMHQEHLRFLEDPWNHHPSNHKAVRP